MADVVLNETVTFLPEYDGHWKGEAYVTHHRYGHQVHRHRVDAEQWNGHQRVLRPFREGDTCCRYASDSCPGE